MKRMPVSLEKVCEELRSLSPEKLEVVASVIHAFNVEAQGEEIHPDWTAVLNCRSKEAGEGAAELLDADEVDSYANRALRDAG